MNDESSDIRTTNIENSSCLDIHNLRDLPTTYLWHVAAIQIKNIVRLAITLTAMELHIDLENVGVVGLLRSRYKICCGGFLLRLSSTGPGGLFFVV